MSTIRWSEFKSAIQQELPKTRCFSGAGPDGASRPLFRGHASDKWKLESTLERRTNSEISLLGYMQACGSARRYAGNYSTTSINFEERESYTYNDIRTGFPNFEYIAYLRHHGFPSPLLDWTESPYVAAFFAFREPPPEDADASRVFMYKSSLGSGRAYCTSEPHLSVLGPFATIHERHAIQQCWYTASVKDNGSECIFCTHEEALAISETSGRPQDKMEFFDIDLSDREEALAELYSMNISAFTLFRSLDSLIETTANRIFESK